MIFSTIPTAILWCCNVSIVKLSKQFPITRTVYFLPTISTFKGFFFYYIIALLLDNIIKEETLECADGRKKVDGPSYWELFAQFYYRDVATPEYCRWYSRKNHVFKSFGKTCLKKDGEWKVKQ
jgi:hypothetical protein